MGSASATTIWPYLSLIWRLRGDPRAAWLDGDPPYIRTTDLTLPAGELDTLATLLRRLHKARAPYLEQSVRGGTQTDRQLFFRHEPAIQSLRTKMQVSVEAAAGPAGRAAAGTWARPDRVCTRGTQSRAAGVVSFDHVAFNVALTMTASGSLSLSTCCGGLARYHDRFHAG